MKTAEQLHFDHEMGEHQTENGTLQLRFGCPTCLQLSSVHGNPKEVTRMLAQKVCAAIEQLYAFDICDGDKQAYENLVQSLDDEFALLLAQLGVDV